MNFQPLSQIPEGGRGKGEEVEGVLKQPYITEKCKTKTFACFGIRTYVLCMPVRICTIIPHKYITSSAEQAMWKQKVPLQEKTGFLLFAR